MVTTQYGCLITARTAYDYDAIANAVVREVRDWK